MKSAIETAIQTITHKAMLADDSADAMRFAQAVHNLANALSTICHAEELQNVSRTSSIGRAIDFQSLG